MTCGEDDVNRLINTCYWEWNYTDSLLDAKIIEQNKLSYNTEKYYPLNIQNNKSLPKDIILKLKALRKLYRK